MVLAKLGWPLPNAPYSTAAWATKTVARLSSTGSDGYFLFAPAKEKVDFFGLLSGAGAVAASPDDARVVRIEHGRPRYGEEITDRHLVQEADQLRAVHFTKGCYVGQEIVERVRSRAQIHRVLRGLEIETSEAPAAGEKLKSGEADAARDRKRRIFSGSGQNRGPRQRARTIRRAGYGTFIGGHSSPSLLAPRPGLSGTGLHVRKLPVSMAEIL